MTTKTRAKKAAKRFFQTYIGGDRNDGDPVRFELREGQVPVDVVCAWLKRWRGADVTLWPVDATTYRAQWFDAKQDVFRETIVVIEPVK